MRPYFSLCTLLFCAMCGFAQSANEPGYTRYTRMEGLSNNVVSGIVQDSLGYIWIGTSKGLNRFDGRFFSSYYTSSARMPMPDNAINDVSIRKNELLVSTHDGAFTYDTYTRTFRKFVVPAAAEISPWSNITQTTVRDDRGHYILSSKTGFYIFDSTGVLINRYDRYDASDARNIEIDFSSWIKELENGLIIHENNLFYSSYDPATNRIDTFYGMKRPGFKPLITNKKSEARAAYPGQKDELFITNEESNSIDIYDFARSTLKSSPMPFNVAANLGPFTRFFFLCDSLVAVTGKITGFYIFHLDPATRRLTLRGEKRFPDRFCNSVFRDREGRFWVGTNDGLYKQNLSNPFFKTTDLALKESSLHNAALRCIAGSRENLFLGLRNTGGVLMLDKQSGEILHHFDFSRIDPESNSVNNILVYSPDTLLVGTKEGMIWVNTKTFDMSRVLVPDSMRWIDRINTLSMIDDGRGRVWISFGRFNSVIYLDRSSHQFTDISGTHSPLLKITFAFSMQCDRNGNIWMGGDGISRWNRAKQKIDTLITETPAGRKKTSYYFLLDIDGENNLWLYSYNNGIIQYNCDNNKTALRKAEDDFSDWHIITSSPVINGHIWMGMDNGISSFSIRNYSHRLFSYSDGLPTTFITSSRKGSWYDAAENVFYLGAGHQLISFHPDLAQVKEKPPQLFVDEVATLREIFPRNGKKVNLSYFDNSLMVDFNAVNFASPEDSRFAYRVRHQSDSNWQFLDWQHSVNFSNLAPGNYDLDIRLFSATNRWPDQYTHLAITVGYPFWRTWWFLALTILVISGLAWLIARTRIAQIREKAAIDRQLAEFELKALHAQMNPHFIFNALNSIKQMILCEDNRNASLYLSKFAQLIRLTLEHSRKTFIPLQQQIEYLESYLKMEQLRFDDFSYDIGVTGSADTHDIQIAPMLLQPLVENAIWHGLLPKTGDKHVSILFITGDHELICEIDDNGIGINESLELKSNSSRLHASLGIENIRERMAVLNEKYQIGCSLEIRDKSDLGNNQESGTLIRLSIRA